MNPAIKARPVYELGADGWRRPTDHTATEERLYGAAVFWLLHWRTAREKNKADCLSRLTRGDLAGRQVRHLPHARRIYIELCGRFKRPNEAVAVEELLPHEAARLVELEDKRTKKGS